LSEGESADSKKWKPTKEANKPAVSIASPSNNKAEMLIMDSNEFYTNANGRLHSQFACRIGDTEISLLDGQIHDNTLVS
jgi:hypothetical protein